MGVPEVRARLRELAVSIDLPADVRRELSLLANDLRRASPVRRSPMTAPRLTPELIERIAAELKAHPDEPYLTIAARFGVNPGRVSEVATGRRRPIRGN